MKPSNLFASTCLSATLLVVALNAPLSAQMSAEGGEMACNATMMSGSIAQLNATHVTVNTSVLIDAAAADVWATLTDFDSMASCRCKASR